MNTFYWISILQTHTMDQRAIAIPSVDEDTSFKLVRISARERRHACLRFKMSSLCMFQKMFNSAPHGSHSASPWVTPAVHLRYFS